MPAARLASGIAPGTTEPGTTQPDKTQPDKTQPDTTQPDKTQPDKTQPDKTQPDKTPPDKTPPDKTPPEPDKVEAIRALARASRSLERASGELSLAHYRVLAAIAAGEQRASRVAARLALGKPTISAAVEALSQRGLIERRVVSTDARASELVLTAAGEEVLARVEASMVERFDEFVARSEDPAAITSALVQLGQAMDATYEVRTQ